MFLEHSAGDIMIFRTCSDDFGKKHYQDDVCIASTEEACNGDL